MCCFCLKSDVSDVTKGDLNEFTFKLNGHKHGFQATSKAERDGWLVAIESRLADAKASREGIVGSDGYKSRIEQLSMWQPRLNQSVVKRNFADI